MSDLDPSYTTLTLELRFGLKKVSRTLRLGPASGIAPMSNVPDLTPVVGDTFETAVVKVQEREYSREQVQAAAKQLAAQISNELEDAYGWHGDDRRDAARERIGMRR